MGVLAQQGVACVDCVTFKFKLVATNYLTFPWSIYFCRLLIVVVDRLLVIALSVPVVPSFVTD
jgi:hypothetical protein